MQEKILAAVVVYLLLCLLIGVFVGQPRTLGIGGSFLLAFVFSPPVGLLASLLYPLKVTERTMEMKKLKDYKELLDLGILNQEQYNDIRESTIRLIKALYLEEWPCHKEPE